MRVAVALMLILAGCGPVAAPVGDPDRGPIEATLSDGDRAVWPGLDHADGRLINTTTGFFNEAPVRYWFLGFGSRDVADSFWFCRKGDAACPIDEHRRIAWDHLVGRPVVARIPGQEGFSPFWQMWVVTVGDDYVADTIKSVATIDQLSRAGKLEGSAAVLDFGSLLGDYTGPQEVLLHFALVLAGTTLKHNGDPLWQDMTRSTRVVPDKLGWYEGYQVHLFDFSVSDGVFPAAPDSTSRSLMPFAQIFVHFRNCSATPMPKICDVPFPNVSPWRPVTERGLGTDITGMNNGEGSNTVVPVAPCARPDRSDKLYSPLWQPQFLHVLPAADASIHLVDTFDDPLKSDVQSMVTARKHIAAGEYAPALPLREDETGNPIPGNAGAVLFDCPVQMADDFVPYPCAE